MEGFGAQVAKSCGGLACFPGPSLVSEDIAETRLVLHTGAGIVFARDAIERSLEQGRHSLGSVIHRFLADVRSYAHPGHHRCLIEALGLVLRNLYPQLLKPTAEIIGADAVEDVMLLWHGSGRGLYFNPSQMVPSRSFRHWVLDQAIADSPDHAARANIISGYFWALTLANFRHPELVWDFIDWLQPSQWEQDRTAILDGICAAVTVWHYLTRDFVASDRFLACQSVDSRPETASKLTTTIMLALRKRFSSQAAFKWQGERILDLFTFTSVPWNPDEMFESE